MSSKEYERGFTDALEYTLAVFNRMKEKQKLGDPCLNCKFLDQIGQLMLLAKEKRFEKIGEELGHLLP